jgi:hypothetical protein
MLKKGTPASPATALASRVLPLPGGPSMSTPLGMRAPSFRNFNGERRNSTTSVSSCCASSTPATSVKRTVERSPVTSRAREWLNCVACPTPPRWDPRNIHQSRPPSRAKISRLGSQEESATDSPLLLW